MFFLKNSFFKNSKVSLTHELIGGCKDIRRNIHRCQVSRKEKEVEAGNTSLKQLDILTVKDLKRHDLQTSVKSFDLFKPCCISSLILLKGRK